MNQDNPYKSKLTQIKIIPSVQESFIAQNASLNARLKSIEIPDLTENKLRDQHALSVLKDRTFALVPGGNLVKVLLDWNKEVDQLIKEKKQEYLLDSYMQKTDESEKLTSSIIKIIESPVGNTLFNKLLRILDDLLPDIEQINLLATTLASIVKTDFIMLFEQHKYILSEIERLTPQTLIILADYRCWPEEFYVLDPMSNDLGVVQSDWVDDFTKAYCQIKDINDASIIERIKQAINQLILYRYIECIIGNNWIESSQFKNSYLAKCQLTKLGKEMLEYISP